MVKKVNKGKLKSDEKNLKSDEANLKSNNSRGFLGEVFNFILIVFLLVLLAFMSYYLYLNIPRGAENLNVIVERPEFEEPINSEINQFYSNMKFNHNKISYTLDDACDEKKSDNMVRAFDELSKNVNTLIFYPTVSDADINITCSEDNKPGIEEKHFVAGEGGAKEIIQTGRFNVITQGVILLYDNNKIKTIDCDYPNVELHELMHVFGFDHVNDEKSLMYPFIESCDQKLDSLLIDEIKKLYSQKNLPDLYFEEVSVTKKGRYIDFNITIKNSGSVNSGNVILTILDNDNVIEERDLGEFDFGSGVSLQTRNLKLKHLNPDKITFILDNDNKIKEIDEDNNFAIVKLN